MNRIGAILDPDIGWTKDGDVTILVQSIESKCGCAHSWWLFSETMTWTRSIDWNCIGHAAVK